MTGWIIFGSIVLVIALVLAQSARVIIAYDKNPDLPMIEVKFTFFTIYRYPSPPKKKKAKKKKREKIKKLPAKNNDAEERSSAARETDDGQESGESADIGADKADGSEKTKNSAPKKGKKKLPDLEMIKEYIESAAPPIKRLFRKIRVRDLYIDWVTASDDAAKTAIKYGTICAAVYSTAKFLTTYFDVKPKEINIEADFSAEKDDIFVFCVVKLRLSTAIACAVWLLIRVLKTYFKYNKAAARPAKKQKAKA